MKATFSQDFLNPPAAQAFKRIFVIVKYRWHDLCSLQILEFRYRPSTNLVYN